MGNNHFALCILMLATFISAEVNALPWPSITSISSFVQRASVDSNCSLSFDSLSYVGVKFDRNLGRGCFKESLGSRFASGWCKGAGGISGSAIRYNNSEFNEAPSSSNDGYYMCSATAAVNIKKLICQTRADRESSFNDPAIARDARVRFHWVDKNNGADGNCLCSITVAGIESQPQRCDQRLPFAAHELTAAAQPRVGVAAAAPNTTNPAAAPAAAPTPAAAAAAQAPGESTATPELEACIQEAKRDSEECNSINEEVRKVCSEEAADGREIRNVINAGKGAYVASKSGSGAQQECFKVGVLASGSLELIKAAKDKCDITEKACNLKCDIKNADEFEKKCKPIAGTGAANLALYTREYDKISKTYRDGTADCKDVSDVNGGQRKLSELLSGVGNSLQASMNCMCRLSNGGSNLMTNNATGRNQDSCNIPNPADCSVDPTLAGCNAYVGISVCTPGSGYDAKLCSCQTNPKGAGCPGGGLSGNLVGFASGANINTAAGGGVGGDAGFGSLAGNLKASGDVDLSGVSGGDPMAAGNLKLEETKTDTANSAFGGGGTGGGGSGSGGEGGGDPTAYNTGYEESTKLFGINGLFNQAKSFMSGFGGSGNRKNNNAAATDLKNVSGANKKPTIKMDQFRPRGMAASDSDLGRKNMDIWRMMNMCTSGENCKSNVNNYILEP
jgi:hypothetical protein